MEKMTRETTWLIAVLVAATAVMILNETIMTVALPAVMADFHIAPTQAQWLTTGFLLTMAVVIPTTGFIVQRFSTRAVFLTATTLFLSGTIVAATGLNFPVLLLGRVIQASGTALVFPLLMSTLMTVVPAQRRGEMMGWITIVIAMAPAFGPTTGGILLQFFRWNFLFWFMTPIVAALMIAGYLLVRNVGESVKAPLDVLSVVLSALGFGGLIYALSGGGPVVGAAASVVIAVFIWRQLRRAAAGTALLDLRVFRLSTFTHCVVVVVFIMALFLGSLTIVPIYLQQSLNASTVVSGLAIMPNGLFQAFAAPVVGRIFDQVGIKPLVRPGLVCLVAGLGLVTLTAYLVTTPIVGILLCATGFAIVAVGVSLCMGPLMTTALASLSPDQYPHGSAILSTLQQFAGAVGTAILIAAHSFGTTTSHGAFLAFATATVMALSATIYGVKNLH